MHQSQQKTGRKNCRKMQGAICVCHDICLRTKLKFALSALATRFCNEMLCFLLHCSLPHDHIFVLCLLPSLMCLLQLPICTYLNTSPIACPPSSLEIDQYIGPIFGFHRYIGISQNSLFYQPQLMLIKCCYIQGFHTVLISKICPYFESLHLRKNHCPYF